MSSSEYKCTQLLDSEIIQIYSAHLHPGLCDYIIILEMFIKNNVLLQGTVSASFIGTK